jgi:hypothetical protein
MMRPPAAWTPVVGPELLAHVAPQPQQVADDNAREFAALDPLDGGEQGASLLTMHLDSLPPVRKSRSRAVTVDPTRPEMPGWTDGV